MISYPTFLPLWMYTLLGALLLWANSKVKHRAVYGLTELVHKFVPETWPRLRTLLELVVFLTLGTLLATGLSQPSSIPQAFAAGLGWTTLASK